MITINDLMNIEENVVSVNLIQYSTIWMGDTGVGKTYSSLQFLKSISPEGTSPLYIEFEDRYQNISGIKAVRIKTMPDFISLISALNNPKIKEIYSCLVIDTLDKFEEMCEQYVTKNANAEIIKDVGAFGEGTSRFKASLRQLGNLQNIGIPVHFIAQASHNKDLNTKEETDKLKLNKNTFSYVRESAYLVGYLYKDRKGDRYITFTPTREYPDLKDAFNMPKKIPVNDLKEVWENAIKDNNNGVVSNDITVDKTAEKQELSFEDVMKMINDYGSKLYENNHSKEADAILKKHLGIDNDGNIRDVSEITSSQYDLATLIGMDLYDKCEEYNLLN